MGKIYFDNCWRILGFLTWWYHHPQLPATTTIIITIHHHHHHHHPPPRSSPSTTTFILRHLRSRTGSTLDHRSLPPEFDSWRGHIWKVFYLWLCFFTFGGRSAHSAYHEHKSGRKTSITTFIHHHPPLQALSSTTMKSDTSGILLSLCFMDQSVNYNIC